MSDDEFKDWDPYQAWRKENNAPVQRVSLPHPNKNKYYIAPKDKIKKNCFAWRMMLCLLQKERTLLELAVLFGYENKFDLGKNLWRLVKQGYPIDRVKKEYEGRIRSHYRFVGDRVSWTEVLIH